MQENPVEANFGIGKVATFTAEQIAKVVEDRFRALEGVGNVEIEQVELITNLDGQDLENIKSCYFDMASTIKPFWIYALYKKFFEIDPGVNQINISEFINVDELVHQFEDLDNVQDPDHLLNFLRDEKKFNTAQEVRNYLTNAISLEDLALATNKYSSNITIPAIRGFMQKKLGISVQELSNQCQEIIHRDFDVQEIYLRGSSFAKANNAHNTGSFRQLNIAYQNLYNMTLGQSSALANLVFNSLSRNIDNERLERYGRRSELSYIFGLKVVGSKAGTNTREAIPEQMELMASHNVMDISKLTYRTDINKFIERPVVLDSFTHVSDFAFVEEEGRVVLKSYLTIVRTKVTLQNEFVESLIKKAGEEISQEDFENFVLDEYMKQESVIAQFIKRMIVQSRLGR